MRAFAELYDLLSTPYAPVETLRGQRQRWLTKGFALATLAIVAVLWSAYAVKVACGQEVINFGATWCGPCQSVAPTVESLRQRGFKIRHVDIDADAAFAASHGFRRGIDRVPLFVAFDASGKETKRAEGILGEAEIVGMLPTQAESPGVQGEPVADIGQHSPWQDARVVKIRNYDGVNERGEAVYDFLTGNIVSINGEARYVISCAHGLKGKGDPVLVVFNDGKSTSIADVVAHDPDADCSVIKLRCEPRKQYFEIGSADASPGQRIFLGGFVHSKTWAGQFAECTEDKIAGHIVVNVPSISGQSGGPVTDINGRLVGVISATDDKTSVCCSLTPIRRLLDDCFPGRPGVVVPRVTPPSQLVPIQPQQVLPAPQGDATCDPRKFEAIESRLKALENGKQDKGDYASRGDIPTIPTPPDLSGLATKGDVRETNDLLDRVVGTIGPAIDARLSKLPTTVAGTAATSVLGVPTWLAAPIALVGGPAGVGLSLAALIGYRRLKRRVATASVSAEYTVAGGRQNGGFHDYGDVPIAGRIVPRDANGNPIS